MLPLHRAKQTHCAHGVPAPICMYNRSIYLLSFAQKGRIGSCAERRLLIRLVPLRTALHNSSRTCKLMSLRVVDIQALGYLGFIHNPKGPTPWRETDGPVLGRNTRSMYPEESYAILCSTAPIALCLTTLLTKV